MADKNTTIHQKSFLSKLIRFSIWTVLVLIILLAIGVFSAHIYLRSNEEKILSNIAWLNDGTVTCHEVYLTVFENFPKSSIVIKDVLLQDAEYETHWRPLLKADQLTAGLSIGAWRDLKFRIDDIQLSDGEINIHKDDEGYDNLESILTRDSSAIKPTNQLPEWLADLEIQSDVLNVDLSNMRINIIDEVLQSTHVGTIDRVVVGLEMNDIGFDADVEMDLQIDEMTFNRKNGSYLADTKVKGDFQLINKGNSFSFEEFELYINDQQFLFEGMINDEVSGKTSFELVNNKTNLAKTLKLLPDPIEADIAPYKIAKDFYSRTKIILEKNQPSHITVDFRLEDSDVVVDGVNFKHTYLDGKFINRKYDDYRSRYEKKGNLRVILNDVSTFQRRFRLTSDNILIHSNPIDKATLVSTANVTGPAAAISDWYKSDKFFFENGQFDMTADVKGALNDINEMIIQSRATLSLSDIDVLYRPADVSIPVNSLILEKEEGDAQFSILTTTLTNEYDYALNGGLKNLTSLLVDFSSASASSVVDLHANKLGWSDFVELFSRPNKLARIIKDEKLTKQSMKNTLRGIYRKFEPRVSINIDTFEYFDKIDLYALSTGVLFEDENNIRLDSTTFDLTQGNVFLECKLDISEDHKTQFQINLQADDLDAASILPTFDYFGVQALIEIPELPDDLDLGISIVGEIDDVDGLLPYQTKGSITFSSEHLDRIAGQVDFEPVMRADTLTMKSTIKLSGSPKLFNDYFKNDQFIFQNRGTFIADFDYIGNISTFDDLVAQSEVDLNIIEGAVLYEEADIVFELSDANLYLKNDTAEYVLNMRSDVLDRSLDITGEIIHVSELFYGNTGKDLKTEVNIYSPVLNVEHATYIFESPTDTLLTYSSDVEVDDKSKSLLRGLLNRFDPDINLQVDSVIVSDKISFTNLITGAHLADSSNLILEQTDFKFSGGDVRMSARIYVGEDDLEPLSASVNASDVDVNRLLSNLEYLNIDALKNTALIEGDLSFDLEFEGALRDLRIVEVFTDAELDIELLNLRIKGAQPLIDFGTKYKRPAQFEDVRFAPLINSLSFKESRIAIPQFEVQSTAANIFVEGYWDDVNGSNIWVTIPLDNLKKKYLINSPPLEGYAANKWKVFMEFNSEGADDIENELRWSKRKYYRQRGKLKEFKADRRLYRLWRKAKKLGEKSLEK